MTEQLIRCARINYAIASQLLLCLVIGCKGELKPPEFPIMKVGAWSVDSVSLPRIQSLIGEFGAIVQSDMAFQIAGRIEKRFAEVGDPVRAGDTLAQISSLTQRADVAAATAALDSARATLNERRANLARIESLLPQKGVSRQEYDEAKAAFLVAQGDLVIRTGNLESAETHLSYTFLKATVSGIIIARKAEVGQVVGPGESVFTIAADSGREATFEVFAVDYSDKPITDEVELSLQSDPSVKTVGFIREISPLIDDRNGTFRVKVTIPNPPPQMTLGSPVIGVAHFTPVEVIPLPWSALAYHEDIPSVWVVDPNTSTVTERALMIRSFESGFVYVRDGIERGELVVTSGTQMIRPGQKVCYTVQTPKNTLKSEAK